MKNPLAYVYIAIRPGNGFRRIEVTHHPGSGEAGEVWFGPYAASKNTVLEAVGRFRSVCRSPAPGLPSAKPLFELFAWVMPGHVSRR